MSQTPQTPHGRVVVGFDGSALAERALDRASDEARLRGTALEILAGWPWPKRPLPDYGVQDDEGKLLYSSARRMMDRAVERARSRAPDTLMIPSLTTESAAEALLRCGRTASLTVIGTRGHGGFAGLLLGSVTLRVAAHCTTPLMVVRGDVGRVRDTVLLGLASDTDTDVQALRFAFDEAARRDAELRVLHTWQFPAPHSAQARPSQLDWDDVAGLRKAAEAIPQYAVARLAQEYPDVRATALAVCQSPAQALVEDSREADVLILAAHRRPRHFGLQLGPVTHAALHHAHCPVVLVPTG
ncbi:universal stress protein [Streptomyces olivaceiscleroticus]|uniref:Universal stress protein n=1 Tax=Streptomyces olivaceiscleroticus TaxID=68245 RepID=A0ABP3JBS3_9ACTN